MRWIAIVSLCCLTGCSEFRPGPKRSVLNTFDDSDRIVANGYEITDADTIAGLREIYRTAKWRPFLDTEPVDQISIKIYRGDDLVLTFRYGAGWLMDESRKGILNEDQRKWMIDNIRSKIPEGQLPDKHII